MECFIPRQRDDVPFNRAGRAIKKSVIVCDRLAVNKKSKISILNERLEPFEVSCRFCIETKKEKPFKWKTVIECQGEEKKAISVLNEWPPILIITYLDLFKMYKHSWGLTNVNLFYRLIYNMVRWSTDVSKIIPRCWSCEKHLLNHDPKHRKMETCYKCEEEEYNRKTCVSCENEFIVTKGDVGFFTYLKHWNIPTRCKPCREKRRRERDNEFITSY